MRSAWPNPIRDVMEAISTPENPVPAHVWVDFWCKRTPEQKQAWFDQLRK